MAQNAKLQQLQFAIFLIASAAQKKGIAGTFKP
jgi:hypothetical protein